MFQVLWDILSWQSVPKLARKRRKRLPENLPEAIISRYSQEVRARERSDKVLSVKLQNFGKVVRHGELLGRQQEEMRCILRGSSAGF
jgi:hypothetical protein